MELPVVNLKGEQVGTVEVSDALLAVPMNNAVVHQVMVGYAANKRQGTHSTLSRHDVSGGGRKPWMQKHTGRARQGSIRAPQWRHGGVAHGPHPRSYRVDINRKVRHLAMRCMLSAKAQAGKITVVEALSMEQAKTKEMRALLQALGVTSSALLVDKAPSQALVRSARNLPQVRTLPARLINAAELLRADRLVITREGIQEAEALWAQERDRRKLPAGAVGATTETM